MGEEMKLSSKQRAKKPIESVLKTSLIVLFCILLVLSLVILFYGWLGGHFDSIETLQAYIDSFSIFGPVVLTVIQILQVIVPVIPGFLGCIVGTILFGPVVGFLVNYIGISLGSIAAYYLARRYGIKLVDKMINTKKYEKYIEKINKSKNYTLLLFLAILLPLAPDDFLCYFTGLIDMSPKKFTFIILIAKPWCILFYSIFFAYFA